MHAQDFAADAVIFATGINGLKKIVAGSPVLSQREEFRRVGDLGSLDVLAGESDSAFTLTVYSPALHGHC